MADTSQEVALQSLGFFQPLDLVFIGVGGVFVVVFTVYWFPKELEGAGEGRLPKNFQAGFLFALMNLLLFVFLLAGVFISSNFPTFIQLIGALSEDQSDVLTGLLEAIAESEKPAVVVAAIGLYFGLFGIAQWRAIEAGAMRQLHSVSFAEDDEDELADRLETCAFHAAQNKQDSDLFAIDRLERRLSANGGEGPKLNPAEKARKLDALLTFWKDDTLMRILPRAERPSLENVRLAHQRRMTLAARVEDYVEKIEMGERDSAGLAAFSASLKEGEVSNEDALDRFDQISPTPATKADGDRALQPIIRPLIEFLNKSYGESLSDLVSATAKAVILTGDSAPKKLKALTSAGFSGIGSIAVIDLHRAVFIILLVFFFVVAVFFTALQLPLLDWQEGRETRQPFIFVLATSLTIAVIVGTMVGGLRKLANEPEIPWAWYVLAALSTAVAHVVAVVCATVLNLTIVSGNAEHHPVQFAMAGSLVPFSVVLGICLLSRCKDPAALLPGRYLKSLPERRADALCFASILLLGGIAFNIVVEIAKLPPPVAGAEFVDRMRLIGFVTLTVGAFIGPMVVHHVRAAALSRIVEDNGASATAPAGPAVAKPPPISPTPAAT